MDYIICQAFGYHTKDLPGGVVLYDLACKWFIHFLERVCHGEFLNMSDFEEALIAAVGKFHIGAHIKKCFALFSPNFIKGIGQVDREIQEMLWSSLNMISRSARTMTVASRRELFDDHMRDWNWKKLVGMGKSWEDLK